MQLCLSRIPLDTEQSNFDLDAQVSLPYDESLAILLRNTKLEELLELDLRLRLLLRTNAIMT